MHRSTSLPRARARQAGFSFIEILVVMGIISVLVSMVVVLIPTIQEKANQTKSKDNVKSMITLMLAKRTGKISGGWPRYSGKNFILSLVANNQLDRRNKQNLEILFSPGDPLYTIELVDLDRYKDVTSAALKNETDFHELTSYAGRRNGDREHLITSDDEKRGVLIVCDDDDGPLHHTDGIVAGYTNGAVRFIEWEELDMAAPEDARNPAPFLGDDASNPELQHMWGSN
jgi:prepilin-type N-terminal cleavage/methylation domain-containing protein